jgi:hypothetical protein
VSALCNTPRVRSISAHLGGISTAYRPLLLVVTGRAVRPLTPFCHPRSRLQRRSDHLHPSSQLNPFFWRWSLPTSLTAHHHARSKVKGIQSKLHQVVEGFEVTSATLCFPVPGFLGEGSRRAALSVFSGVNKVLRLVFAALAITTHQPAEIVLPRRPKLGNQSRSLAST